MYTTSKSYQNLEQVGEVFDIGGKPYIKVKTAAGTLKSVRVYPNKTAVSGEPFKRIRPVKDVFGFSNGFITIYSGKVNENEDFFKLSPVCWYNLYFGWYTTSEDEIPRDLPNGIEPIQLSWKSVSEGENLLPMAKVQEIVGDLTLPECHSRYQGAIGDIIDVSATVIETKVIEDFRSEKTFHLLEDDNGNLYTWTTGVRSLEPGRRYSLRGTVKEFEHYKNQNRTVLTRCRINV